MSVTFYQIKVVERSMKSIGHLQFTNFLKPDFYFKTVLCVLSFSFLSLSVFAQGNAHWSSGGQNNFNTRHASTEFKISVNTVSSLAVKWVLTTEGDVSATPAVDAQNLYFPDWAGNLYCVDANTGVQKWKKLIKDYTGQAVNGLARATPAISGNTLVIGTQLGFPFIGAWVLGINKNTGDLIWKTQVDAFFAAIVTQSAVIHGDRVYVGVASQEENFAADPGYPCCTFRGSLLSLDLKTGQIIWKTYMTPGSGFSGNAVWGSTPVIDPKRNSVYITTGNNYTVPQAVLDCNAPGNTPEQVKACVMAVTGSSDNHFDAIVSLDLTTGAIKWSTAVIPFDAWTVACFFDGPNCPENAGPDYDFGQGPALFTAGSGVNKRELLGAGQKSGVYTTVNPDNGEVVWSTQVGPGGTLGGLQWGSAVDGNQIYTAISNNYYIPHLMTKGPGAGNTVNGGFWAALNAETGEVNWEYAGSNPPVPIPGFPPPPPGSVAINTGMVTSANGVVFAAAMDAPGTMYAFNAQTGQKLWSFESGGTVNAGPAVVNGNVYWGSGYSNFGLGTFNNKLYAFHVPASNAASRVMPSDVTDKSNSIGFYPSPVKDVMRITSYDNSNIKSVKLFDLTGRLIKEFKTTGTPIYTINLGTIANGTYIINVTTTTRSRIEKIVVVH